MRGASAVYVSYFLRSSPIGPNSIVRDGHEATLRLPVHSTVRALCECFHDGVLDAVAFDTYGRRDCVDGEDEPQPHMDVLRAHSTHATEGRVIVSFSALTLS